MKELLLQIAAYRRWANKILIEKLSGVNQDIIKKDMGSSFKSIYETLHHVASADNIWWQRLHLKERVDPLAEETNSDFGRLGNEYLKMADRWVQWIENATEQKLLHVIEYRNSKREAFKQPVFEILLHVFNHQTYHHGQIITMLRQQEIDKLPSTDFSTFTRTRKKY